MQIHPAILAAQESIPATKFRRSRATAVLIAGKPVGSNPGEMQKSSGFPLQRGGFSARKRQNNNFLDCALHFVIC
jgi:hypothetical protein